MLRKMEADAAAAAKRLDDFLNSIGIDTLPDKTAAGVIDRGKQIVCEIVNSDILKTRIENR